MQSGGGLGNGSLAAFLVKAYREYGQRMESHDRVVATRVNSVVDDGDCSAMGRDDTQGADL